MGMIKLLQKAKKFQNHHFYDDNFFFTQVRTKFFVKFTMIMICNRK